MNCEGLEPSTLGTPWGTMGSPTSPSFQRDTLRRRSRHARERLAAASWPTAPDGAHTRAESEAGEGVSPRALLPTRYAPPPLPTCAGAAHCGLVANGARTGAHPSGKRSGRGKSGVTDRTRTGTARLTTSGARRYTTATMSGDDRTRTGNLSPDKRALSSAELRPRDEVARVGFEPTISSS
jgi:hypothetical protein